VVLWALVTHTKTAAKKGGALHEIGAWEGGAFLFLLSGDARRLFFKKGRHSSFSLKSMRRRIRPPGASGLCGVAKDRVDRWAASIYLPDGKVRLGIFDTKEKAAAAYDSTARLHFGQNAFCNYATQMDAEEAIRGANDIRELINDGRMELIGERYGEAKQQEALHFIVEMLPIWRKNMARYKKKKAAKRAAVKALAAKIVAMELPEEERAATIAERAAWDAAWAAANLIVLSKPSSHMVCRALVPADGAH
jgi:hypothetical protein